MKANKTDVVFFDSILAVADRQVQSHDRPGTVLREVIRQTSQGTPLTYRHQRGQTVHEVMGPVQVTTRKRLAIELGLSLLVTLDQLGMGALFLLRPNTNSLTNLAASIGALATGGTIYVGEATAQRLKRLELRDLGPQQFKNVGEPVTVYEVLGQRLLVDTSST